MASDDSTQAAARGAVAQASVTTVGYPSPWKTDGRGSHANAAGANDIAAFHITGPDGHDVLDGGYASTAQMIMTSIAKLGFDIKDVKVLLNSEPHPDHAGGLAVLQQAPGAEPWARPRGCTSWSFSVREGDRVLKVVPRDGALAPVWP